MDRKNILVTRLLPMEAMELLYENFNVEVNMEDKPLSREELLKKVKGKDGVLCFMEDRINSEVFDEAGKKCKVFINYAVQNNNIDIEEAYKREIFVISVPKATEDVPEEVELKMAITVAKGIIDYFAEENKVV